jgi:putative ABC transport system permease protein
LSLTIVLTVGLGIGGTAAVFSVVYAVLLKPLPYPDPGRVVRIYTDSPPNRWPLSVVDYQAIDEQQTTFESLVAYNNRAVTLNQEELAERIFVRFVTPGYFPLLGITPLHGRTFVPADAVLGAERTAVLAHRFWRERLGADPDAIGRLIRLDGNDYTVVGVLPPRAGPLEAQREMFPILQMQPPQRKGPFMLRVLGRLRPDAEVGVAEEELRAINERIFPMWKSSYPDSTVTYGVQSLHEFVIGNVGTRLLVLLGAVGFVLLIASTNAANLLVARGTQRGRELAVRAALGASRGRLVQHLLTESALLAAGGAALGLIITFVAIDVMAASGSTFVPRAAEISLSGAVLWFMLAVTLASGLLFGLIPSLQATRSDFERTLGSSGRGSTGSLRTQRVRRVLVASQFAVAVPLLIGAGLLLTSFTKLQRVDPGIDQNNLITARISLPRATYMDAPAMEAAFWGQLTERVGALPGVVAVGSGSSRPPDDLGMINNFNLEDKPAPPDQAEPVAPWPVVSPEFFQALGIPLIRGRMFDERDRADAPRVVLVDQAWVRRFFPGEDPIGKRLHSGGCNRPDCPWLTVIGVVGDAKYMGLDDPGWGTIYQPVLQNTWWSRILFVRTTGDPLSVVPAVRTIVRELDPTLPLSQVATMDELMANALDAPRNFLALIAGFAAVALMLAAIGIYGVMSYFVQQHTRDIGIRMALGGRPAAVLRLIVGRGMRLVILGIAIDVCRCHARPGGYGAHRLRNSGAARGDSRSGGDTAPGVRREQAPHRNHRSSCQRPATSCERGQPRAQARGFHVSHR